MANGLAAHVHNVTIISPDVDENPAKGVHHIFLEGIYNDDYCALQKGLFDLNEHLNPLMEPINYNSYWYSSCRGADSTNFS